MRCIVSSWRARALPPLLSLLPSLLPLLPLLLLMYWLGTATAAPAPSLRFEQLSVEHGLAQESILSIVQDGDGFMWFGSQAGLSRFDGYRVTTYRNNAADPHSLVNNRVQVLHVDSAGRLWIGTGGGLDRFDPATRRFVHFQPNEPGKRGNGKRHIHALLGDGGHGLWVATSDGLQHVDTVSGAFKVWRNMQGDATSLASDQVNALALDAGKRLWVGTASGLDSMAPGATGFTHHAPGAGSARRNTVHALLIDAERTLWIGSLAGLERWKPAAGPAARQLFGAAEGIAPGGVGVLFQDGDATVWAGSTDHGLFRWLPRERRFANFRHQPHDRHSLADNRVSSLFRDRVGTFWVGTWHAGVSRVDLGSGGFARIVKVADDATTLSDNKVRAIVDDGAGKLWLGTNAGLNHFDPASGVSLVYRHQPGNPNSLPDSQIHALALDRSGVLWAGGRFGITGFDTVTKRFTRRLLANGDPDSNTIRGMLVDLKNTLWITSRGGLHRLDLSSGALKTFRHDPADGTSLADNSARPMLEDRRGQLWVGTSNGLDLLDRRSGTFRHFRHDPADPASLSNDEVHYLLEARSGALWVGTAAGLNQMIVGLDGRISFKRHATAGLAGDAIAAMLEADDGQLWISSNTGLSRFSPQTGSWRNYSAADGTIEGAYFDAAALKTPDGTLYFGGFNGITAFNPRAINANLIAPRAVITGFQVFNRPLEQVHPGRLQGPIEQASNITLDAADSVFSLEFSALHYAAPQRNLFAYQLIGFDDNWVATDAARRFATYTNLDPGRYIFRLKAANKDGLWSPLGATLAITILPPFWKRWWMRTLLALLVLGGAFGAFRCRERALRQRQVLLEQQVRARTAEIGQQNELLSQQARELERRRIEAELQRFDAEQRRCDAERQSEEAERQRQNIELAHRNISMLSEIGREMAATLDMETIMGAAYRHVQHLMATSGFCIGIYREQAQQIEFPFAIDAGVRALPYGCPLSWPISCPISVPDQLAVWCLTQRRAVFINDLQTELANYLAAPAPGAAAAGIATTTVASTMLVPLTVKQRVIGVLCVQSAGRHAYGQAHLDMLAALAAHAAVALDNASAYHRLGEMAQQVRRNTDALALANRALQDNDESLRLARQKAEDTTRQKSEFLASMSHEMRTPLAGVIGMLGFALRDSRLEQRTREQILRGQANAQSLLVIINDLLDFSKIEAGKVTIEQIDFALALTLDNVASLFEEQAAANSVALELVLAPDLPRFVVGDPARLRQVLVNLVGNAFKFTSRGAVTVQIDRLAPDALRPGSHLVRFAVHDSGIGIAPAALARLFHKFEQADSSTARRYGGTGLGLAICRQLVELMGGRISAVSEEGVGSCFSFVVPLADGVAPAPVLPAPRAPHSHRLKVLCAEDYPSNQIIIRTMLEELGHEVDIADNGDAALAACARSRYDLILMDGRMPELDGASATRLIRAGGPLEAPVLDCAMMIIALTANASDEDRARYLACGMDDFLSKPIDEAALHAQLGHAIARQHARGIVLAPMVAQAALVPQAPQVRQVPGSAELDALFGVPAESSLAGLAGLAGRAGTAPNAGRRSGDLKARIRRAFASDLPARRAQLEAAIAGEQRDTAARLLHGIRGSAAYLDATELHVLCGELEAAADLGQWNVIGAAMERLRRLLATFEVAGPWPLMPAPCAPSCGVAKKDAR